MAGESQDRVLAPVRRLTADEVTDDHMDVLQDTLDEVYDMHYPHDEGDWCTECHQRTPCRTVRLISRQRSKIQEFRCRRDSEETT